MLREKVSHMCRSYRTSLDMSETLVAEISVLRDWINKVKPTLSTTQLSVTKLSMHEMKDLLASYNVCMCIVIKLQLSLCVG